jgi:hypothetical protein
MHNAVSFLKLNDVLILVYTPRDDDSWVHAKFDRDEELVIKRTFHFRRQHLLNLKEHDEEADTFEDDPLQFQVATLKEGYYCFDSEILPIGVPLLIHQTATINWKWFTAEQRVSIFKEIAELRPRRIVIGGDAPDAIPTADYENLIENFPTRHELKRYVLARVGSVIREYSETQVDAERLYRKYVAKRLRRTPRDLMARFRDQEQQKYEYLLNRLQAMLAAEQSYPEAVWQTEILQIILLLNPKYIKAVQNVPIRDLDLRTTRRADILLVDASGNVDLIEIKQPFDQCIITPGQYRNNHIPLRELSGAVMQIEKYIYYLNRWGKTGEDVLTERYQDEFPEDFKIRITNPSGIIIMGRDNNLSPAQLQDFEVVKRKYTNIVDIITYDDLLRRLEFIFKYYKQLARLSLSTI